MTSSADSCTEFGCTLSLGYRSRRQYCKEKTKLYPTPFFDKQINGLLWSHVNASLCHGDSPAPSRCLPFLEVITMRFNPYPTCCQEKTQTTNDSVKGTVRPWISVYI
jgi:hypothetical protein